MNQRKILKKMTIKVTPPVEKKDPIEAPACVISMEPFERGVKGRRASAQFVLDKNFNPTLEIKMSEESAAELVSKENAVSPITRGKIQKFPGGIKSISCDEIDRLIDRRNRKLIQKSKLTDLLAKLKAKVSKLIDISRRLEKDSNVKAAKGELKELKHTQLPDQKTIADSNCGPEICSVSKRPFTPAANERPVAVVVEDKQGPKLRIDLSEAEATKLAAQPDSPLMMLAENPFKVKILASTDLTNYCQEINNAVDDIEKIKAEIDLQQRAIVIFENEIQKKMKELTTPVFQKVSAFGSTITVLAPPKPQKRSDSHKTSRQPKRKV